MSDNLALVLFRNTIYILIITSLFASPLLKAQNFQGGIQLRWDSGEEADPTSNLTFPDNLTDRHYFESLISGDFWLKRQPFGGKLRMGFRMLELQSSEVDGILLYGLQDERRLDDKLYAQWSRKKWEIWIGDVYETFGKGLTLNLFENRDLYFDSGLRGGKVSYKANHLRIKAIYGKSRQGYLVKEENIGGANVEYRAPLGLFTGVNLVHQEGINYEKQLIPGIYSGIETGPVSVYMEYAQLRPDDGKTSSGDGTFFSVSASTLGFAAQVGYKYYNFGIDNPFQTPPITQREYTTHLLSAHPHIPLIYDQVGLEVDLSASPSELVYLNLNFSRSTSHVGNDLLPPLKEEYNPFWELFLEGELYLHPDLTLKIGGGQNEEARNVFWEKKTGLSGETIYNLNELWSVTLDLENMWVNDKDSVKHDEQWMAVTLSRAPYGSVNFSYEQSSLDSDEEGDQWMGIELALNIRQNHRLLLFYGRERGGLKCTSGVCRPVQPFEGFKLTFNGRF